MGFWAKIDFNLKLEVSTGYTHLTAEWLRLYILMKYIFLNKRTECEPSRLVAADGFQ